MLNYICFVKFYIYCTCPILGISAGTNPLPTLIEHGRKAQLFQNVISVNLSVWYCTLAVQAR